METSVNGDAKISEEKKTNIFKKAFNIVFNKEEEGDFTAESAWLKSTYGSGISCTTEERIANKQKSIKETIKSKFRITNGGTEAHNTSSSYRCIIDIEEDLAAYKDVILQPFINNGFKVINLSEKVEDIEDENVYLISWKNIFKKK